MTEFSTAHADKTVSHLTMRDVLWTHHNIETIKKRATCPYCQHSGMIVTRTHRHCHNPDCPDPHGDVLDVLAHASGFDVQEIHEQFYDTPFDAKKRQQRLALSIKKARQKDEAFIHKARSVRQVVMAKLWEILSPQPITHSMRRTCIKRGIDPRIAHQHGVRDAYGCFDELSAYLNTLDDEALECAGLINNEGKLWWPLRYMDRRAKGIIIPGMRFNGIPQSYRWRFETPVDFESHTVKSLSQPVGLNMEPWQDGCLHTDHLDDAEHIIIVEGEPDYLSMCQMLDGYERIGVVGMCGKPIDAIAHVLRGKSPKRISLAIHQDRDKHNRRKHPIKDLSVADELATWASQNPQTRIEVFDVWGQPDINDLLQQNQHHQLKHAILEHRGHTNLTDEFGALTQHYRDIPKLMRTQQMEIVYGQYDPGVLMDRETGQQRIREHVKEALEYDKTLGIIALPGLGKTHHTTRELFRYLVKHPDKRAIVTVPTHQLAREQIDAWRDALQQGKVHGIGITEGLELADLIVKTRPFDNPNHPQYQRYLQLSKHSWEYARLYAESVNLFKEDPGYHARLNAARIVVMPHARFIAAPPSGDFEIVVIDEDLQPGLSDEYAIDSRHLEMMLDRGILSGNAFSVLNELLEDSIDEHIPHKLIKQVLSGLNIELGDEHALTLYGEYLLELAIAGQDFEDTPIHEHVPQMIVQWAKRGFEGFDIKDGQLLIPVQHKINFSPYKTIIALDATGTDFGMQAIYGLETNTIYINARANWDITRINMVMNKRTVEQCQYNANMMMRVFDEYPDALIFTNKALNPHAETDEPITDIQMEVRQRLVNRRVCHYKSADARGSNKHKHEHTVVMTSYMEPAHIINRDAARLLMAIPSLSWEDALKDARFRHNAAEMIQAAYRLRPNEHSRKRLVYFAECDLPGLFADQIIEREDIEDWLFNEAGLMPYHGYRLAERQMQNMLASKKHGWLANAAFYGLDALLPPISLDRKYISGFDLLASPPMGGSVQNINKINTLYANHCEHSWLHLASKLNIPYTAFTKPTGGQPVYILGVQATTIDELVDLLEHHGFGELSHVTWMGQRVQLSAQTPIPFGSLDIEQVDSWRYDDWLNWLKQTMSLSRNKAARMITDMGGLAALRLLAIDAIEEREAIEAIAGLEARELNDVNVRVYESQHSKKRTRLMAKQQSWQH